MPTTKGTKKQAIRNNEYYDTIPVFDMLYHESKNNNAKFKKLLKYILDENNIRLAFRNIKNNHGSKTAGTDGKTIKYWAKAPATVYINYVKGRLANFKPEMVKRVEIPKEDGRTRPLGIPTIGDRLVQQCIKQVLEPICEAKFHHHSFGFRPNRSTEHAMAEMYAFINVSKLYHVVDIDIKGFFDNVNHGKLLKQMWNLGIQDKNLLSIISKMLKAEIKGIGIPDKGTPQGGILSPLLSNIVLNELDWWISNQFETFQTRHKYPQEYNRYVALRRTKLKEVFILRYADDFKLFCRTKEMANKAFKATTKWLKERLGLEISPEKSCIVDVRKEASMFLGLEITTSSRRNEYKTEEQIKHSSKKVRTKHKNRRRKPQPKSAYVVESHVSEKAKKKIREKLKKRIKEMRKKSNARNANLYNSTVLGIQNYYRMATHVNIDFGEIAFIINRILHNRLKNQWSKTGIKSELYKRQYKNNYKVNYLAEVALFPLADIRTKDKLTRISPIVCNYTIVGREKIHSELKNVNTRVFEYLHLQSDRTELSDNKISRYVGQDGKCAVTGEYLRIGFMEIHHVNPVSNGGTDKYDNLRWVTEDVHTLIHATLDVTINKYLSRLSLSKKQFKALNDLRVKVGNLSIQLQFKLDGSAG